MLNDATIKEKTPEKHIKMIAALQENLALKDEKISQQQTHIRSQLQTIQQLLEQLKLNRHRQFGAKSEKHIDDPQALLFDEAQLPDDTSDIETADETLTVPEHQRKKTASKAGRKPLPADLVREERIYDLTPAEKICDCGCELHCIGDVRSEQLGIVPAKVFVIVHVRKKYACKGCAIGVKQAKLTPQPIAKSIASPELLAHINIAKFEDYLPLYRQERILQQIGVDLPRASLSNWVIKSAELLRPLYNLLRDHIQDYDIASADETKVQVLKEPGREAQKQSYMWLFGGGPPNQYALIYHYAQTRGAVVIEDVLTDFKGYLHSDGYSGYDSFALKRGNVVNVGCWYHARRYFIDAEKLSTKA